MGTGCDNSGEKVKGNKRGKGEETAKAPGGRISSMTRNASPLDLGLVNAKSGPLTARRSRMTAARKAFVPGIHFVPEHELLALSAQTAKPECFKKSFLVSEKKRRASPGL